MTRTDMYKIFAAIQLYYPDAMWAANASEPMIDAWAEMLSPYSFEIVSAALKRHVVNSTHAPKVSDILLEIRLMQPVASDGSDTTVEQKWTTIVRAVKNSAYNSKTEYEKLPEDLKRRTSPEDLKYLATVEDDGTAMSVYRANFFRSYGKEADRHEMDNMMPDSVKKLMPAEPVKEEQKKLLPSREEEQKQKEEQKKERPEDRRIREIQELVARMTGKVAPNPNDKICPESKKPMDWKRKYVVNCRGCQYFSWEEDKHMGFCTNGEMNNEVPFEEEGREK